MLIFVASQTVLETEASTSHSNALVYVNIVVLGILTDR